MLSSYFLFGLPNGPFLELPAPNFCAHSLSSMLSKKYSDLVHHNVFIRVSYSYAQEKG